jgi:hypothetical protein
MFSRNRKESALALHRAGKPQQNGFVECLNRSVI